MIELKTENGSLNVWCPHCGIRLDKTTEEFRELAASGKFEKVSVCCEKCKAKTTAQLQLGNKEFGV